MAKEPVRDFTTGPETTLAELLERFNTTGGFTAAKLATAASILRRMRDADCTVFMSFPADIMATGTRGVLRAIVRVIVIIIIITVIGHSTHETYKEKDAKTTCNDFPGHTPIPIIKGCDSCWAGKSTG